MSKGSGPKLQFYWDWKYLRLASPVGASHWGCPAGLRVEEHSWWRQKGHGIIHGWTWRTLREVRGHSIS